MSKFVEDTKKILDFFENKGLQEIFTEKFIHKDKVKHNILLMFDCLEKDEGVKYTSYKIKLLKELGL